MKATHCDKCSYETEEGLVITGCAFCGCHNSSVEKSEGPEILKGFIGQGAIVCVD